MTQHLDIVSGSFHEEIMLGSEEKRAENPWTTLSSREVYTNPWIRIREDKVLRPDGKPGLYGYLEAKKAVGVVALTAKHEVYLVGQYRYPIERYSWEIIEGGADEREEPLTAGRRELQEEAGLEADKWEELGPSVHLSNCITNEEAYFFLARDLREVPASPEPVEVLTLRKLPVAEAIEMTFNGEITDAMSIIALLRVEKLIRMQKGV